MRIRPFCLDSIPSHWAPLIGHAAAEKTTLARCGAVSNRIHDPLYYFNGAEQLSSCYTADRLAGCFALAELRARQRPDSRNLPRRRTILSLQPETERPWTRPALVATQIASRRNASRRRGLASA
jgi:hypothetical protein